MKETKFGVKFISELEKKFPYMWCNKIVAHEMQASFIPDYLACMNGLFIGLEFKVQRDGRISITPGQIKELNRIKNSKGIALLIGYDENKKKILLRERRLDWKPQLVHKSKYMRLDWDFETSNYEDAIEIISFIIENNGRM